jgi:PAS domain S-box-containing protein
MTLAKSGIVDELGMLRKQLQEKERQLEYEIARRVRAEEALRKQAGEQICLQDEFLHSVLESLVHPFYVVDADDYAIRLANPAAGAGTSSGSTTCYALTHGRTEPCTAADHPCPLEEIKRTKRPVMVEHIHQDATGQPRNVQVHSHPLFDDQGNVVCVIEYTLDVTEQQQADQALRQNERQFRQVLETLQEGIWAIDGEANTTFVNPRMAEMLGYTGEEMVGKSLFAFMDERFIEIAKHNLARRAQGIREQHDFEFLRRDGTRLYALLETSPILDDEGNYAGALAGIQDITERKRAEEALRKSQALLQETQRMAKVGGWEFDLETEQVRWTEEVYRIHELPLDFEPNLESALSFYVPEQRPILQQAVERAIQDGEPWDLELELLSASGKRLWVRAIGKAERQDDRVVKLSGTFQDITGLKQVERALADAKEAAEEAQRREWARRQEAERRRRVAEGLSDIVAALNSDQDQSHILDYIAGRARQLLEAHAAAIYRLPHDTGAWVRLAGQDLPLHLSAGGGLPPVEQVLSQVVLSRKPVAIPHLTASLSETAPPGGEAEGESPTTSGTEDLQAWLAVPIVVKEEVFGALVLHRTGPRRFSIDDIELACVFGGQVTLAIESARLQDQVKEAAAMAERSRLARDLHDSVTQALFSASLVAEVLPQVWRRDPEEAQEGLQELRHLTRGALAEMRAMLLELRPTALLETKLHDLLDQLTEAATNRTDLDVTRDIEPVPALPPEVHVTFYRVAREALHNVVKHADARQVRVGLGASPPVTRGNQEAWEGQVVLEVSDDGRGFDPGQIEPGALGLGIMRERAEAVGASLEARSAPGRGTQITLTWPTRPAQRP